MANVFEAASMTLKNGMTMLFKDGKARELIGEIGSKIKGLVSSVNGKTGDVTLDKTDVGLGNVANVLQYSASNPPPYPVTSVNGQTGAASLAAADVGAVSKSGDTMTGALTNNGYSYVAKSAAQEDGVAPSVTTYLPGLFLHDKNGSIIGCFREIFYNSGIQSLQLYSRRKINGNDLINAVRLNLNSSGDASVSFSHPEAWYKAIGYVAGDTISFPASGNSFFTRFHGDWRYTNVLYFFIPTSRRCAGLSATLSGTIYIVANGTRNAVNVADVTQRCFCTEGGIAVQLAWETAPSYGVQFAIASVQPYGLTITFS